MIRRFTCSNFRNIEVEDLAFGRINLLIGPNNAGKSNFIRALSFSANMVNHAGKDTISGFLAKCSGTDLLRSAAAADMMSR